MLKTPKSKTESDLSELNRRLAWYVEDWAAINSGTSNQTGVDTIARQAADWLAGFADQVNRVPLPPIEEIDDTGRKASSPVADAVVAVCRPEAPRRVLLNIHLDTVYGLDQPFQTVCRPEPGILHGPGVADAKGGLVVMLAALEAFERSEAASKIGWEVILNPDEEMGSPASAALLQTAACRADIGLVYEPTLPDGTLIRQRKGSGNFTVVVRGRSAHAGREITSGRNALAALCRLFVELEQLNNDDGSITLNLGRVVGGGPVNIVPDLAVGRFNVRVVDSSALVQAESRVRACMERANAADGITVEMHGGFTSPPKRCDAAMAQLFDRVLDAGREIGLAIDTADSGGVCDGNKLAAAGLPTVDTLGPRGGHIHSDREYLLIDSLAERMQLSLAVLNDFAQHPDRFPSRQSRGAA